MDLQHLKTFIAVADAGSLTRAGEVIFLSQPAVSAQIKALETEAGLRLFRRTSRGMAVTDAGAELLERARDIVRRADGWLSAAERLKGEGGGELRLGVISCGYDLKVAAIVGKMMSENPGVELKMNVTNSATNLAAVLDQTVDVAFIEMTEEEREGWGTRGGQPFEDHLAMQTIGTSRLGVVGPAEWEAELAGVGWAGLAERPWIFQSEGCSYHGLLMRVIAEQGVSLKPRFEATAFGSLKELVSAGLGLSICDVDDAAEMVASGELFVWPHFRYVMPVRLIALVSRAEESLVSGFCDLAIEAHRPKTRRRARPLNGGVVGGVSSGG